MSVTQNPSSPPQQQYNQQHKREDKRDDRNKNKNYPYDPCKIVGFQNKETNEFALSMLKAQGMQPQPEEHLTHDPAVISVSTGNSMPPMPMQVQSPPQPNAFMAMPIYNAPSMHGHPSVQMQAIATTAMGMGEYQWTIGDQCLAKYWDDEKVCLSFFYSYLKKKYLCFHSFRPSSRSESFIHRASDWFLECFLAASRAHRTLNLNVC